MPAGWIAGLDEPTERAWRLVSQGLPEIEFVDRDLLFRTGLTILLVEAATYHRRWANEFPEKYGSDVLGHIRRGLGTEHALKECRGFGEPARTGEARGLDDV